MNHVAIRDASLLTFFATAALKMEDMHLTPQKEKRYEFRTRMLPEEMIVIERRSIDVSRTPRLVVLRPQWARVTEFQRLSDGEADFRYVEYQHRLLPEFFGVELQRFLKRRFNWERMTFERMPEVA